MQQAHVNGEKIMDFTPVDYDVTQQEQNCAEGKYAAEIADVRITKSKPDGEQRTFAVAILDWRMTGTDSAEPEHQNSIGATVSDRITFFPQGDRRNRMGKQRLTDLGKKMGIDIDALIPKRIESKADFDDLIGALKGSTLEELWVTHTPSKDDPNTIYENVRYMTPRGQVTSEEAPATPSKGKPAAKGKPTNKRR